MCSTIWHRSTEALDTVIQVRHDQKALPLRFALRKSRPHVVQKPL